MSLMGRGLKLSPQFDTRSHGEGRKGQIRYEILSQVEPEPAGGLVGTKARGSVRVGPRGPLH
jgi:hypothetical protein